MPITHHPGSRGLGDRPDRARCVYVDRGRKYRSPCSAGRFSVSPDVARAIVDRSYAYPAAREHELIGTDPQVYPSPSGAASTLELAVNS